VGLWIIMSIKAIFFDLGLTLIRTIPFEEIYRQILEKFGIELAVDALASAQKKTANNYDTSDYEVNTREEFWTKYNVKLLENLGIEKNRIFIASMIDELWWNYSGVKVFSDVKPTLSELKNRGLKIGLVSNGYKKDLDHVLGELDLGKWFDSIVCIDSCNCAKPNKEIFLFALKDLEINADEAIFVGDSVKFDYEGALKVGIKPFLIDRDRVVEGNYDKIEDLTDLLGLI
jgi:putative hydrolase of the HAD superfamily